MKAKHHSSCYILHWALIDVLPEAINLMKCDEDFSLQDRVFDIMTQREHPDDLYEVYLTALSQAKKERDKARRETVRFCFSQQYRATSLER